MTAPNPAARVPSASGLPDPSIPGETLPDIPNEDPALLQQRLAALERENDELRRALAEREAQCAFIQRRAEQRRVFLEKTRLLVYDFDVATGNVEWAGASESVLGYREEVFCAFDHAAWLQGIHPDDRGRVAERVGEILDLPQSYELEYRYRNRAGSYLPMVDKGVSLADASGQVQRVLGVMSEVSEQKVAEVERLKLARLLEMGRDFVGVATLDGEISYLNNAALDMVGLAGRQDAAGRNILDFFSETHRHHLDKGLYLSLLEQGVQRFESSFRNIRTGVSFPVEVTAFLIKEANGTPLYVGIITRDLTEAKRIETELLRSRDQYLQLFEHFPALVWRSGTDARCNYFNATWLAFTGRTLEEEIGDGWLQGVHPADLDLCRDTYLGAFAKRVPFEMEYRLRHRDGTYRWIVDRGTPYRDLDGNYAGYLGSCYDISEQKKQAFTERLMRRERDLLTDKLQKVLERMPVGCILSGPDFRITYWNQAAQRIFGFSKEEVLGRSPYDFLVPEADREYVSGIEAALRASDAPVTAFNSNRTKDGRLISCEWHNTMLRDADQRLVGFISMALDVTDEIEAQKALKESERKQQELNADLMRTLTTVEESLSARIRSEQALSDSERELRRVNSELKGILDAVQESLILFGRDRQIIWANRGGVQLGGAPDFTDATATAHISDPVRDLVRSCFATAVPVSDQILRHGEIWEIRCYPILDHRGEVQSVLKVGSDVTSRVRQQEQVVRNGHLASLGELAAGVAHEINNPTHGILNYAEHLIRKFPEEGRIIDICSRIIKESERIAHIVRALLDFSRNRERGKTPVRIREILDEALTLCKSQLRKDNIRVFVDDEGNLPAILADPQQIVQVILNLVSNARYSLNQKYPEIDSRKTVSVFLGSVPDAETCWLKVSVTDQGNGIPKQIRHKVLSPFFTTKPSGVGTGLGLSVTNSIIADHGGRLEISSLEGEWTTVSFLLPQWSTDAK
ncbi:PAS domain-containing sensor histidine kinase [Geomesophilobacter sediminis]|uniref:histidine kinase n=1 Tax=Geomesophilobacter sediminis TaxID=2798584 RepID=A0A8J7M079_9BACT|nr:PAS domain S-box protein [Geomesophilobacter sediminis]MBJ6723777.1 PAS domain S-box protein [Geomesophilobacter sediminis]